jgi:hypothetical protein
MFVKEKTVEVMAQDYVARDAVAWAEVSDREGRAYCMQVLPDMDAENPRKDYDHAWTWSTTRGAGYSDSGAMDLDDWNDMTKKEQEKYLVSRLFLYRHSGDVISCSAARYPFNDQMLPEGVTIADVEEAIEWL